MGNQRYTMKSLATIEAQTAAYGAENAATQGAVVNMVTKSGLEQVRVRRQRVLRGQPHRRPVRAQADPTAPVTRLNINPGLLRPHHQGQAVVLRQRRGPPRIPWASTPTRPGCRRSCRPSRGCFGRGSFKLTWQINPRHKLSSFSLYNREAYSAQSDGNYDREPDTLSTTSRA